jgi:hypothetical protein
MKWAQSSATSFESSATPFNEVMSSGHFGKGPCNEVKFGDPPHRDA